MPPELIAAQAEAIGAEMRFYYTSWGNYEERFITTLRNALADGIANAVFGDIDLVPHREWEEKVCAKAGIAPLLPLWDEPRRKLVDEFLALGFKAAVVCVNGKFLGEEFVGREFDEQFLADLPASVDACGENGEFHTFVYDRASGGVPPRREIARRSGSAADTVDVLLPGAAGGLSLRRIRLLPARQTA